MRTLEGVAILVTRPRHQAEELAKPLRMLGARVTVSPAIEIGPPPDLAALDSALRSLLSYDWVVLTSANGVEAVHCRMLELQIAPDTLSCRRIAVIGPATARAVADRFRTPDLLPCEFVSEAIADALGDASGMRFLLARADLARKDLATTLRARGAEVDEVAAYSILRSGLEGIGDEQPEYITLTSSEAARAVLDGLERQGKRHWFFTSRIACIGPVTAETVRELGVEPAVVAKEFTTGGLVSALADDRAAAIGGRA